MTTPILELRGVSKSFGPTLAMSEVSLALWPGTIHALVGENGAGKSTLIKAMTGLHRPSSGTILVDGREVAFRSTADAQRAGVAAIYQEPMVFPDLSVAENIFASHHDRPQWVGWRRMEQEAEAIIRPPRASPSTPPSAGELTLAEQQTVEIARASARTCGSSSWTSPRRRSRPRGAASLRHRALPCGTPAWPSSTSPTG
jgi:rhamnose transport system ATP-binding protein